MPKLRRYTYSHEVSSSPQKVWDIASDHEGMASWTPLRSVQLEQEGTPERNGVGAIRRLNLVGPPMREQITAFEPTHHLAYRLLSGAPVRDYVGEVNISPSGSGARIAWSVQFRPLLPGARFVVALLIRQTARSLAKRSQRH